MVKINRNRQVKSLPYTSILSVQTKGSASNAKNQIMKAKMPILSLEKASELAVIILFISSAVPYSYRIAEKVSVVVAGVYLSPVEIASILLLVLAFIYKSTIVSFIVAAILQFFLISPFLCLGIVQNGILEALGDVRALVVIPAAYVWTKAYVSRFNKTSWWQWTRFLSWLAIMNAVCAVLLGEFQNARFLGLSEPILVTLVCLSIVIPTVGRFRRYIILTIVLVMIGLSGTRGLWLSFFITVCAIVAFQRFARMRSWHMSIVGFFLFAVVTFAIIFNLSPMYYERFISLFNLSEDSSMLIRGTDISLALAIGNQRPLLGYGFGKAILTTTYLREGMYVDNTWITAYVKGGIILIVECLILFVFFGYKILRISTAIKKGQHIPALLVVGWFAFIFVSSFRGSLLHSPSLLMLCGIGYGILGGLAMKNNYTDPLRRWTPQRDRVYTE